MRRNWNRDAKSVAVAPHLDARLVCLIGLTFGIALTVIPSASARGEELELAWEYATPQLLPMAVVADQEDRPFLYVALKNGGLGVLDVSKVDAVREAARVDIGQLQLLDVTNLTQRGKLLLLALGEHFSVQGSKAGVAVVDIANPRSPRVLSVWQSPEKLNGAGVVVSDERFAYLGAMSAGVMTFDISEPRAIRHVSTFQPDVDFPRPKPNRVQHPNARGLAIRGDLLYVANDAGGLRVLDVTDRNKPREIGRYINAAMARKQQAYNNLVLHGDRAYIAVDYAGMEIVDISNPRDMRQVGWWNPWESQALTNLWFNSPGHTNQLVLDAKRKLLYLSAGDSELQVLDVSDQKHPRLVSHYGQPKNKLAVWGLTISDEHVFLSYITAIVPFQSSWSGVKAIRLP